MITVRKLRTLSPLGRMRKCAAIFHYGALGKEEKPYLCDVSSVALETASELNLDSRRLQMLCLKPYDSTVCADICYEILHLIGAEPADWDFVTDEGDGTELDSGARQVLPITLVLDRVRSPFNVGSIFRTADSFGVQEIVLIDGTASPEHSRAIRTSRGTEETVPWLFMSEADAVAKITGLARPVIALELGGTPIGKLDFPSSGVGIVGSEEFGVSPALLKAASIRASIPLGGCKGSLNVSVATGIFLYSWFSKIV
ncbi:MAG: TrmH family RNA methyltransferase [Sphaerochaetaceae bacterium]